MTQHLYKNLVAITLISFSTASAFAAVKGIDIIGRITDTQDKSLDFVNVSLLRANDSTLIKTVITNEKGEFILKDIPRGSYKLLLTQIGMKKHLSATVNVTEEKTSLDLGAIKMETEQKELVAVTVTAKKPLIERQGDKLVVNVSASSVATGATALEVLQRAPGVSIDKDDNIALRGKQGVLIMLDGKPTYLSATDLSNLLRNMQSNEIDAIEIITNPSARYEAEGKSGIINIRLKKNKNYGTNGSFNNTLGYSGYKKAGTGLTLNNRSKHFNLFGNYNYNNNKGYREMNINRTNNNNGTIIKFEQANQGRRYWYNHNFKVGADYFINDNHTIGTTLNGYFNTWNEDLYNETLIKSSVGKLDSSVLSNNTSQSQYNNLTYNLNYKGKLDSLGREISVDLDYSRNRSDDRMSYNNRYIYSQSDRIIQELLDSKTPSRIDIYAVKLDYVHPFSKTLKLEAGYKSSWVSTNNNFQFTQFIGNNWVNDPLRSNHFLYKENINAGYLIAKKEIAKWQLQVGLRAEQTNSNGNLVTTGQKVKRHYLDFFPSASVNFTANEDNTFGLNYSRRITRPSYDALNPFEFFLDKYTYNKGNPFLKPEYTNNIELSYTLRKKYNLSLGYTRTTDGITQVLLPNQAKAALYQTNENLAEQTTYSLNISAPVSFTKWWNSNTNITVFQNNFDSPNLNGVILDNKQTSVQVYHNEVIKMGNIAELEISGNYQSRMVYGTFLIKPMYRIDLGLSKNMLDKKLNIKIALNDVFKSQISKITSAYPGLDYNLVQRSDSRVGRLSITYRFGNNNVKPAKNRATAIDSENNRLKQ